MSKIYVAYGSNMVEKQMAYRCPDAKIIGKGTIQNFRLMFKGTMPDSYATIEPEEGFSVPVIIWEISAGDEKRLDMYEGLDTFYYKREIAVETAEGTVNGMVYIMNEENRLNPPCDHYYAAIYEAYEKFGFDTKILEEALQFSDRRNFWANAQGNFNWTITHGQQ